MSVKASGGDAVGSGEGSPFDDLGVAVGEAEPLAPHTWLGVGGPAKWFCEPVDVAALDRVVKRCQERSIPLRVIGGGSNVLAPAAGFAGMVVRLSAPAFSAIEVEGTTLQAGAGAKLVHVVAAAVQAGLSGLETLVGIPGTVGGALVGNAGGRGGDIGDTVRTVTVMTAEGTVVERAGADLTFGSRWSNLDDVIVIGCRLVLEAEDSDLLTKRMQKRWIVDRPSEDHCPYHRRKGSDCLTTPVYRARPRERFIDTVDLRSNAFCHSLTYSLTLVAGVRDQTCRWATLGGVVAVPR